MDNNEEKLFIWYWKTGGYNSCKAKNKAEALEKAKKMAGQTVLEVDEDSIHEGTYNELANLDRRYSTFD